MLADSRPSPASSTSRLIINTALIVSAFLLLVAYLDHSTPNTIVFGGLTVLLLMFMLMLRTRRSR